MSQSVCLQRGDFVRVKSDVDFRGGLDGMVIDGDLGDSLVGLIFGFDRHNHYQQTNSCGGPEAWHLDELDLDSIEH